MIKLVLLHLSFSVSDPSGSAYESSATDRPKSNIKMFEIPLTLNVPRKKLEI